MPPILPPMLNMFVSVQLTDSSVIEEYIFGASVPLDLMFFQMLHKSSARSVYNAFGFSGRPARVHYEQGMVERELLKVQSISVRNMSGKIYEFWVEDFFAFAFQFDVFFLLDKRKHDDLKI